jgi:hypothetical protein
VQSAEYRGFQLDRGQPPTAGGAAMDQRQIVCLGLGLLFGSSLAFVISWIVIGCFKNSLRVGVDRIWFRCLSLCFYIGLAVLFASALGSIVQNTVKGSR